MQSLRVIASLASLSILLQFSLRAEDERAAYMEQCMLSIRLSSQIEPVEVQHDSFLGRDPAKGIFVAVICQPNPLRTFRLPEHLSAQDNLSETRVAVQNDTTIEIETFTSVHYKRDNHPARRSRSSNLFFASRDHFYYVTAYVDPATSRYYSTEQLRQMETHQDAVLQFTVQNMVFDTGVQPAISEEAYVLRFTIAVILIGVILSCAGLAIFWQLRKRNRNPTETGG